MQLSAQSLQPPLTILLETMLMMKKLTPVRLMKNNFFQQIATAEARGASNEELKTILGKSRAKKGMFEGDMNEGELEIGQISAFVKDIKPARQIVSDVWNEFLEAKKKLCEKF